MNKKKHNIYTIMVVPEDNGRTFYFKSNRFIIYALIFFIVSIISGAIVLILNFGAISAKIQMAETLFAENRNLRDENKKLHLVVKKIESMERISDYLRNLAVAVGEKNLEIPLPSSSFVMGNERLTGDSMDLFISEARAQLNPSLVATADSLHISRRKIQNLIPNISPVDGWITKGFVKSSSLNNHTGVDFVAKEGTPIRATAPGIVSKVGNDTYFGLILSVDHEHGFVTRYGHCLRILVNEGDRVKRGQTIALLGNTGRSSAPHVHYEVLKNGRYIDPLTYIIDRLD